MIKLISLISVGNVFEQLPDYKLFVKKLRTIGAKEGDHLTLINIHNLYQSSRSKRRFCQEYKINEKLLMAAKHTAEQLERILKRFGIDTEESEEESETILRCLTKGYFMNTA